MANEQRELYQRLNEDLAALERKFNKKLDSIYAYLGKKETEEEMLKNRILIIENESSSVKHIVKDLEAKIEKLEHEIDMLKPRHVNPDELVDDFI